MPSHLLMSMAPPPPPPSSLAPTTTATGFSSFRSVCLSPAGTAGGSNPTPTLPGHRFSLRRTPSRNERKLMVPLAGSVPTYGVRKDPEVGHDGERGEGDGEEEEESEREAEGSGGNMDGRRVSSTDTSHDQEIPSEIELLLSIEEKAILYQNGIPNLNKISTEKWKSFHTLALSGQIPIMDKLLNDGVNIDAIDKDGYTALHRAVIGKKEAVISHLLRKGANPHCRDRDGATPLHYAVQVGAMQTVKLLIKYKVDVNVADNEGWTPLHLAIQSRSRDIAKVLLINGADKTRRNKDGKTPLDVSLCYGRDFKSYELAKLLKLVPADRDF